MGFCHDNECWRLYEDKVHAILAKGLNDRAKFIRINWRNAQLQWSVNDVRNQLSAPNISSILMLHCLSINFNLFHYFIQGLSALDKEPLFIGISISNFEKAFRMVDIGPNADNGKEVFAVYIDTDAIFFVVFKILFDTAHVKLIKVIF